MRNTEKKKGDNVFDTTPLPKVQTPITDKLKHTRKHTLTTLNGMYGHGLLLFYPKRIWNTINCIGMENISND